MKKIFTILLLIITQKSFSQLAVLRRNDASSGTTSGFFETSTPSNFPSNVFNDWWHLIDVRHTTLDNNFRMQFSGRFFDQDLFFRKTNNVATAPWSKVVLERLGNTKIDGGLTIGNVSAPAAGGLSLGNLAVDYTPTTTNFSTSGCNLFLNARDFTTIGFHDVGSRVDYIRVGQGLMQIGYNGGFGEPNVGLPGTSIWRNNGFVGIGTTSPSAKLQVTDGNVLVKNLPNIDNTSAMMIGQTIVNNGIDNFGTSLRTITQSAGQNIYGLQFFTQARFDVGQTEKMRITGNGFVGIGTTNPQEALSVNGNIRAKQVKVETTGWPDYVFAKEYNLLPIENLAQYIQKHQHLPEIPSASEIEKDGINLGEINKVLIKKIEELTLYMLQQQEEIKKLNYKVDNLLLNH